jgi:Na+/H+ antiporter NhaD/arsenite permease-like protein
LAIQLPLDPQLLAVIIFLVVFAAIATEKVERTIAALVGAAAMWATGVIAEDEILHFIDMEVLLLLFGMMVIVAGMRQAGFFRWIGIHLANMVGCDSTKMLFLFTFMTAILSAFLDNVTTMLFMVAVTLEIMDVLRVPPTPFIISEIFASNIGGTATLIGDPPNIMIGSAYDIGFLDFILNVAPAVVVILIVITLIWHRWNRKIVDVPREFTVLPIKPAEVVEDRRLFYLALTIFIAAIIAFFLHSSLGVSPATVAMMASIFLIAVAGGKIPHVFRHVEWETLIFFASMLVLVGGLEKTGVISALAERVTVFVGGNEALTVSVILWLSALGSAAVDNIPFTATFIPFIVEISNNVGTDLTTLAWALSLGTGLGGNGTPIASAATVVALGAAAARGHPVSFREFIKVGMIMLGVSVLIANLYLLARYVWL